MRYQRYMPKFDKAATETTLLTATKMAVMIPLSREALVDQVGLGHTIGLCVEPMADWRR